MAIQLYIENGRTITLDELLEDIPNSKAAKELKELREQRDRAWVALNDACAGMLFIDWVKKHDETLAEAREIDND